MIPNADQAVISPEKLRDYLLNLQHRRGSAKANLLLSMGYQRQRWQILEADLRQQHLQLDATAVSRNEYGECWMIQGPLTGPNGRTVEMRSIWQIDIHQTVARLITMYPE